MQRWDDASEDIPRHRSLVPNRLPNGERAFVAPAKVRDYLLSPTHPVGAAKSRFFTAIGFSAGRWPELLRALELVAVFGEVEGATMTRFGQIYRVRGIIQSRTGTPAWVVSIWIIDSSTEVPRLVTAYPTRG